MLLVWSNLYVVGLHNRSSMTIPAFHLRIGKVPFCPKFLHLMLEIDMLIIGYSVTLTLILHHKNDVEVICSSTHLYCYFHLSLFLQLILVSSQLRARVCDSRLIIFSLEFRIYNV